MSRFKRTMQTSSSSPANPGRSFARDILQNSGQAPIDHDEIHDHGHDGDGDAHAHDHDKTARPGAVGHIKNKNNGQQSGESHAPSVSVASSSSAQPKSLALAWGLSEPNGPGWRSTFCSKCQRPQNRTTPHGALLHHDSGYFFCSSCGFFGNTKIAPSSFRESWMGVYRRFLTDPAWSSSFDQFISRAGIAFSSQELSSHSLHQTPPALLKTLKSSKDLCWKNIALQEGCVAPFWTKNGWLWSWYAWCRNDQNILDDAYVLHLNLDHHHSQLNDDALADSASHLAVMEAERYAENLNAGAVNPEGLSEGLSEELKGSEDNSDDKHSHIEISHVQTLTSWSRLPWGSGLPFAWSSVLGEKIILTRRMEDWDALVTLGLEHVACLPPDLQAALPNAPAWRCLEAVEGKMKSAKEVVFAFPSDPASRALEDELGRRMDRERCYRVRWRPETDDAVQEEIDVFSAIRSYGDEQTHVMILVAPPFPVVGVYELDDIEERFDALYETGLTPGVATGWPSMDQHYTVKTGQWTLVTGIPGHGKSSWLDALLVNLASMHGWRFGLFSPENQPVERHFASLMEKKLGKPFTEGPTPRITLEEKNKTKRWLSDKFKVILPDEENGLWTLDAVLKLAKTLVYRYGIRGLVIDPWNEIDHTTRSASTSETSHISESLTKIRRFARLYDVHVWIVAHPTKLEKRADGKYPVATPYDVSGGAHWRNKADNAISIYRNVDEDDYDISDIHIQKIRFKEVGRVGVVSLRCEYASGRYIDDIDQHKRAFAMQKGNYLKSSTIRIPSPRVYPKDDEVLSYETKDVF